MTRRLLTARNVIGLAVALVVGVWATVLLRTGLDFRLQHPGGTYRVNAVFDQVSGLTRDSEIRAGGLKVGRVADITLTGTARLPRVTMEIEKDFRLRTGSRADLVLRSNSGQINRYIALTQGTGARLRDGATLGLAYTDQPVEIDQVLSTLDPATRRNVRGALESLAVTTKDNAGYYADAIRYSGTSLQRTTKLLAELNDQGDAIRTVLRDGGAVLAAMARQPQALGGYADQLAGLLQTTARRQHELGAAVAGAPGALRSTSAALRRVDTTLPALSALIPPARQALARLPQTSRLLRPTLENARPVLRSAAGLTRTGPGDLRALTRTLKTLQPQLAPLTHILCQGGPVLDMLRATTPEAVGAVSLFGDINAGYDANGHAARVYVHGNRILGGIAPSDTATSGLLAKPYLRDPGVNGEQPWKTFRDSFIGGNGKGC